MKKETFTFSIRDITEIAMLCALAIVLDKFVKIPIGATGGSLNIAAFPLFVIALRHGWFKGLIGGGIVFGLISCLLDDYGMQCYPFDYFLAFGSVCILGIFGNYINNTLNNGRKIDIVKAYGLIILSVCAFALIRLAGATIDSMLFFNTDGTLTIIGALIYNASYVLPSAGLVLAIIILLVPVILSLNKTYPTKYLQAKKEQE